MMNWLRKHRYKIFLVTIGGFVIGSFMGFGSYFFTLSPYDAAITVNGEEISYKKFQTRYRQYLEQARQDKAPMDGERQKMVKQQALQDLVRETVLVKESKNYGMEATDNEVAAYIQSAPAFQRDGKFDQGIYFQVLTHVLRVPPDEFEEERRRDIRIQKMQQLIASTVKLSEAETAMRAQTLLAQATAEEKAEIAKDPNALREQVRRQEVNLVFQQWLAKLNENLNVKVSLDRWEGRAEG